MWSNATVMLGDFSRKLAILTGVTSRHVNQTIYNDFDLRGNFEVILIAGMSIGVQRILKRMS